MERLVSIFLACGVMAAFAAPTANEDFVVAEDARTYTNAVNAAKSYTDTAIAAMTAGGITTNDVCNIVTNEVFTEWTVQWAEGFVAIVSNIVFYVGYNNWQIIGYDEYGNEYPTTASGGPDAVELIDDNCFAWRKASNVLGLARLVDLPPLTNGLASAASVSAANSRAVNAQNTANAASNLAANVQGVVTTWETYWDGDEVRVTVTNYDSAVHLPSLYLEQKIENTNAYRVVWDERTRWSSNDLQMAELRSAINQKADRAWGFYDSTTGEWAPDDYTWVSSPKIAIAGGLAYQRTLTTSGAIWVLTSNGMVAETGGETENGFFRIRDDEGNTTFEIVRGNKRTVGATAAGIRVTRSGGSNVVTVPYNVVSEEHPTVYGTTNLSSGEWTELAATWLGQSGAWTAQVTTASSTYFLKAEYETGGETYIRNAAPISVDGGLYATNTAAGGYVKIRPKYNGSTITWEVVP